MANIRYVTYTPDGNLDGCYLQAPPTDHATRMIAVDDAVADSWTAYRANAARDGVELAPTAAPPLPTEQDYVVAIQGMLDAKARERRYYGMQSAATYSDSANTKFKTEAVALKAWRDEVWDTAYAKFDQVTAGTIPQPTIPELLAMLPTFIWPT